MPSIPAPTVQPRFLRGGTAPARRLSEAEVIILVGENDTVSFLETRPLPSLASAFSRRRQIFGAHKAEVDNG